MFPMMHKGDPVSTGAAPWKRKSTFRKNFSQQTCGFCSLKGKGFMFLYKGLKVKMKVFFASGIRYGFYWHLPCIKAIDKT